MMRCRKCVMPDTRPDTPFVDGVCAACIAYENRPQTDWEGARKALADLLAQHHQPGRYDCVVPSSGGKDSHAQVAAILDLGYRPLVVTATTCHLTPTGRKNIDNLARYATTIEVTPNRAVRAKLNATGLRTVGDISWPEHVAIFTIPFRVASAYSIPLIFYGENPQREYGGPPGSEMAKTMTRRWVSEFGGLLGLRPGDMVGQDGITEADMDDYRPITEHSRYSVLPEAHFLGQYLPWDSHANAKRAWEMGMQQRLPFYGNWWPHENLDNAQTGLHDHMMYRKYGYGRLCAQVSVDIRAGLIDREAAMKMVLQRDGAFPWTYAGVSVDSVLDGIGMNRASLGTVLYEFTNWALFDGEENMRPNLKA